MRGNGLAPLPSFVCDMMAFYPLPLSACSDISKPIGAAVMPAEAAETWATSNNPEIVKHIAGDANRGASQRHNVTYEKVIAVHDDVHH